MAVGYDRLRRDTIAAFVAAEATIPSAARTFEELGVARQFWHDHLIRAEVLVLAGPGRYYADMRAWRAFERARKIQKFVTAAVLVGLLILGLRHRLFG